MDLGSVLVNGGGCLGAQVAVARIELGRADAMGTVGACKLDATFDAADRIEALHSNEYSCGRENEKSPLVHGERNQDGRSKTGNR
jgi:hypothetical protein